MVNVSLNVRGLINRPTVSIREAGVIAGVSRRTIYNWLRDGRLEWVRTAGGSARIFVDTLFIDKCQRYGQESGTYPRLDSN